MSTVIPSRLDLEVPEGATWSYGFLWMQDRKTFKSITGVPSKTPVRLTVVGHGAPDGWLAGVSSLPSGQMSELNTVLPDKLYQAAVIDANTVELINVNGALFSEYAGGGFFEYNTPYDLSVYTSGSLTVRESRGSAEVLVSLTVANSGLVLNNTTRVITAQMTSTQTLTSGLSDNWYDLDLTHTSGEIHRVAYGRFLLQVK